MKQLLLLITSIIICFDLSAQQVKELTILHTNDTHSHVEPINKNDANKDQADKGGYVRRASFIKQMRAEDKDLLLFDCGDFSQGTPYYNMFKGEVEIKLMNEMEYDAATIGNHEFDFGLDNMARLFKMAKFPFVCANYEVKGTVLENLVKPYVVIERKGMKIGIFGLSPKMEGLVQAEKCEGIIYEDPYAVANKVAAYLKGHEHCCAVICLSHLGWKASANNPECDEELAAKTRNIDLILGGHSHSLIDPAVYYKNLDGKEIPVTQAGKNGIYVGKLNLNFERK
ncbi:metallophosphatase [uncultured Bacteroides sp.]|uniref:bifunctional metallophosphatase/5'-nucleotidase n=1 Tax=uncultured Bacteroides sp. TaxID=162156 RepID=UPI002AAB7EA6|nr:metallophosphatase [uncultured Bacteroides sp.]